MESYDYMAELLLAFSHPPGDSIPMTSVVIPAIIGIKTPVSHPTQAPPADLQHQNKLMRLNWITGLKYLRKTHLLLLHSILHRLSRLMLPGIQMIPHLIMGLPMWLK